MTPEEIVEALLASDFALRFTSSHMKQEEVREFRRQIPKAIQTLIDAAREEGRKEGLGLLKDAMSLADLISGSGEGMLAHEPYKSMKKRIDEALAK